MSILSLGSWGLASLCRHLSSLGKDLARASHSENMPPEPSLSQVPKWRSTNQHPQPKEAFGIARVTGSRAFSYLLPRVDAV
jgi:hypothetical protein